MQTQIFSNPLTAAIAVGSGDLLGHPDIPIQCVVAFVACFILSSILTMIVITSIPLKTLDSFYNLLGILTHLLFKPIVCAGVNIRKKLEACEERLLTLLLRRKLLKVNNPLEPVSKQGCEQRSENGTANTRANNVVIHKRVGWPNEKS
jgi:hypothetical protein